MKFKKRYEERKREIATSGRPDRDDYEYDLDNLGKKILVQRGKTNIYEQIQEAEPGTEIETILAQTTPEELEEKYKSAQNYIDTTMLPKNMIEARRAMNQLENAWNTLPMELKKKYNYSLEEYITKSGSEEWLIDMGYIKPKEETAPTETKEETEGSADE